MERRPSRLRPPGSRLAAVPSASFSSSSPSPSSAVEPCLRCRLREELQGPCSTATERPSPCSPAVHSSAVGSSFSGPSAMLPDSAGGRLASASSLQNDARREEIRLGKSPVNDIFAASAAAGYCTVYNFMQTFMILGTIFMSLLAGALFEQLRGIALVVFAASAFASSCCFLSKMIRKLLGLSLWPDKFTFFQKQVSRTRKILLNYMLFLMVTPTLPNTFINLACPLLMCPTIPSYWQLIGLSPTAYVTVRTGIALGELTSLSDLYDTQSVALLFFIGVVSVTPALLAKDKAQEKTTEIAVPAS